MIGHIFESKIGAIVISSILGLGLAAVFRQVCKGNECIVVKSPNLDDINKYYYKIDSDCFKYSPYVTTCDKKITFNTGIFLFL